MGKPADDQEGRPPYLIESAENALRILLALRHASQVRVTEVSAELGVAPSTAHRLLSTLTYLGFLRHDPVKRVYVPGDVLVEIALASTGHQELRQIAMPHIERLAKEREWTVHLSVLEGTDIRFIDGSESPRPIRVTVRIGSRSPAHSTSSGKVLLASLPRQHLTSLYPQDPPRVTENTIASIAALEQELDEVERNGYATNVGENEVGLHAVSVPIRAGGRVIAAIAAARPSTTAVPDDFSGILAELRATATEIEEQLERVASLDDAL
ncbi:IclR family transcriptional regulator [Aeromicrobium camelliae]|uniref:IclR family transcriptional regulator n=1 Tax=Aeromicrobium camelliae TaxID=1538144 RepID=A0A3N6W4E4_9ACTN|nr:IclR family transcriptional regulator [Aeromicrobium camelliae]RQN02416.1 IclR family transcriptional regulator [Aeromicrobium camelliae]